MKKLLLSSFILSLLFQLSFAQESVNDKAMSLINSDYFHSYKIEKFSLHTNKTVYFAGENIWFKAYIVEDDSNTQFTESANLYLNLYDSNFKLVLSNLFYAENGKSNGEMELPDTLKNGNYYLQLDTQWNKNFNRNTIFPIKIVDLSEANNVNINQEVYSKPLDFSKSKTSTEGFEINRIESTNTNALAFEISPKTNVINSLDNSYGFAVLHREGSVRSMAPIKFNKNKEIYKINFAKADALNGFNTISIFNENKEELYSKNFFYNANTNISLKIHSDTVTEDSLTVNFNLFGSSKLANISVSVLPEQTKVYTNLSNIVSDFLIKPYIDTDCYNTARQVTTSNQDKLDAITQLDSKSNVFVYNTLQNKNTPYKSEAGLTINGKVNTKLKNVSDYKVMLSSEVNSIKDFSDLDSEKQFKFEKLLLTHPSKYSLSLLNKKGKIEKANFFIYNTFTDYRPNPNLNINVNTIKALEKTDSLNNVVNTAQNYRLPEFFGAQQLEEVNLEVYKEKKELELKQRIKNSGIMGLATSKVVKPEDTGFNNNLFLTFLQTLPSTAVLYNSDGTPELVNTRGPKGINSAVNPPLSVVWDGAIQQDLSILAYVYANEIDYVVLNINGTGYGSNFPNGVLHVVSKKGYNSKDAVAKNKDIVELDSKYGFIKQNDKYKLPDLAFSSQRTMDNFSTLDWIPNFNISPGTDNYLKINRKDFDKIKLVINGITEDGIPFYKEEIIEINSN